MVKHRIVLTGGGTGGHVYPALSVAEQLKEDPDVEAILYIGARDHLEERLAAERNIEFIGLSVGGMPRKLSLKMLTWPFQMFAATMRAQKVLLNFKPTAVLGTGGYASAPPLAAAWLSSIPYAIHEPDAHPGLVNRVFGSKAKLVSLGMEGAAGQFRPKNGKVVSTGNPVGKNFVSYGDYFDGGEDEEALVYLWLANKLIHSFKPEAVTIAEEMSGMPGLAASTGNKGYGFDYRLSMGVPDFWIKLVKDISEREMFEKGKIKAELVEEYNKELLVEIEKRRSVEKS